MDIDYYIGAYLEITCNKISVEKTFRDCINGHGPIKDRSKYCPECGLKIDWTTGFIEVYPTWFTEILSDEFENVLLEITPRNIFNQGTIIAIGNRYNFWLSENESYILPIPTVNEAIDKILQFDKEYAEIIQALNDSPIVQKVVTKFGIIKKEW